MFLSNGSTIRHPLPSAGSPGASSPASRVIWDAPTPCRPSRRVSFPSLGGTTPALRFRISLRAATPAQGPGVLGAGYPNPALCRRGDDRVSQVPGEPPCEHALLPSDPGGTKRARPIAARRCSLPRLLRRRLPRQLDFRGSMTRPAHSLCTLRSAGYPNATQHSLPAAGQLCRAGLATRWVPMKGFSS